MKTLPKCSQARMILQGYRGGEGGEGEAPHASSAQGFSPNSSWKTHSHISPARGQAINCPLSRRAGGGRARELGQRARIP